MPITETPAQVLDCKGLQCPVPVIKTAQAIKTIEPGQVLELLATDPGVEPDMKAWSSRTGNELLAIDREGEVFHVVHAGRSFLQDRLEGVKNLLIVALGHPEIRVIGRSPHQCAPRLGGSQPRGRFHELLASCVGPADLDGDAGRDRSSAGVNRPGVL